MIAASSSVGYISEPFNPVHSRGIFTAVVEHWYFGISGINGEHYEAALRDAIEFR